MIATGGLEWAPLALGSMAQVIAIWPHAAWPPGVARISFEGMKLKHYDGDKQRFWFRSMDTLPGPFYRTPSHDLSECRPYSCEDCEKSTEVGRLGNKILEWNTTKMMNGFTAFPAIPSLDLTEAKPWRDTGGWKKGYLWCSESTGNIPSAPLWTLVVWSPWAILWCWWRSVVAAGA